MRGSIGVWQRINRKRGSSEKAWRNSGGSGGEEMAA